MLELLLDPVALGARLADLFVAGGFVMPPLAVATLLLWYTLGQRAATLVRGSSADVRTLLAVAQSDRRAGVVQRPTGILDTAAWRAAAVVPAPGPGGRRSLRRHLDELFADLEAELVRGRKLVHAVVTVAPLLGLLGTVTGMVETFDSLAEMALFSQGGGVAAGVAQALLTTQVGLVVAIPGIFADRLLARRQSRLQAELDELKELAVHTRRVIGPAAAPSLLGAS